MDGEQQEQAVRQAPGRRARAGTPHIAIGAVLLLFGVVNVAENGGAVPFLVALLGIGLVVAGFVLRGLDRR